jgi:uncharacterized membrane protein YdfJ with MMPL/SSD domain
MRVLVVLALLALAACSTPTTPQPDTCVRADSQAIYPPDGSKWWIVAYYTVPCDATGKP